MGVEPQASAKNGRKATVESENPNRGPPDPQRQEPPKDQTPQQNQQAGKTQKPEQQTATTAYQAAGPGFTHRVTNSTSGLNVSGINPALGQQQNIHQTHGFPGSHHPAPGLHGNQSFVAANTNSRAQPGFLPYGHTNNHLIIPHQPFHASQVNQPFLSFPHFPCHAVSTSIPLILVIMADYGNGYMPNTGQHFQPPVPDTTYGPIQHTYHPRFDSVPRVAGSAIPVANPAAPCACPLPVPVPMPVHQPQCVQFVGAAPSPQVSHGITTAPIPVTAMAYQQQPALMQAGQPIQAVAGAPAQHMLAQPAMMPTGGQSMVAPGGPQPPVMLGNGAPGPAPALSGAPDVMGIGKTQSELTAEQLYLGSEQGALQPQDFKPADDDPARMYFCRELDGEWILRNRYTLDNVPVRWYMWQNGVFYAVRLEE